MIFRINEFKESCNNLSTLDSKNITIYNDVLELKIISNSLVMSIANKEYFVSVSIPVENADNSFHATVNANLFLKLISKITTDTVELNIEGTNLLINGNGKYTIPMIFDSEKLLVLDEISINNVKTKFTISGDILSNIYNTANLLTIGRRLLIYYLLLVGVYSLVSYVIYSLRYTKMRKSMKAYYGNLKKLARIYEKEQWYDFIIGI